MGNRIPARAVALGLVLSACTFPPLATPTPTPSPRPSPTPAPTASPTATPVASPTPGVEAVPDFAAGDQVATRLAGLRVRQRPSLAAPVVTGLLPFDAGLQVVMGPILAEDLGWYLVTDVDEAEPEFDEGWIAAGFEPEPWLAWVGDPPRGSPYVASLAGTGRADDGPIRIGDGEHLIRWVASDTLGRGCRFAVTLAAGDDEPVPAIRATIGEGDLVPGTLQPAAFDAVGVRGQTFVSVQSDCSWALVIQRVRRPSPSPSPSAGG